MSNTRPWAIQSGECTTAEKFHRLKRVLYIANTDDITQQIAILKDRLVALDREQSETADQLGLLERAQSEETAKPSPELI